MSVEVTLSTCGEVYEAVLSELRYYVRAVDFHVVVSVELVSKPLLQELLEDLLRTKV